MNPSTLGYYRLRFPSEIISYCVWLYFRFPLSFRDIEEMMAERGVTVAYESVREWCLKFRRGLRQADALEEPAPRRPLASG